MVALLAPLAALLLSAVPALLATEAVPQDDDVVAGWLGAVILGLLILATVLLLLSFLKQLRKAQAAKDAGVYGDPPVRPDDGDGPRQGPVTGG